MFSFKSGRAFLAAVAMSILLLPSFAQAIVGPPQGVYMVGGQATHDTTPTFVWSAGGGATWYDYKVDNSAYTGIGNVFSVTLPSQTEGWHTFSLRSHNNAGEINYASTLSFEILGEGDDEDTDGPYVPTVSPSTATEDEAVTFSVYPTDESGVDYCNLYIDGASQGSMSHDGSRFYKTYTFSNDGAYSVYARCTDEAGNSTTGSSRAVNVYEQDEQDNDGPYVPTVSPSTATEDESVTFNVYPTDESGVDYCSLYIDGGSVGTMSESGDRFSKTYTFTNDGAYTVYARCTDNEGNATNGSSRTVTVYEEDEDDRGPNVPTITPSSATEDEEVIFSVYPTDESGVDACTLYVDGDNEGAMTEDDGTFTKRFTFSNDGTYSVYARCTDGDDNSTNGNSRTVTVYEEGDDRDGDFEVPAVSPATAWEDVAVRITVEPEDDDYSVSSCNLYVDGSNVGSMSESNDTFSKTYTFAQDDTYSVYARCTNSNGETESGPARIITVTEGDDDVNAGDLIKIICPDYNTATDPCRSVYYFGDDGKRHAFPNEGVFYTWYSDFDDVVEVSADYMAHLAIGQNVTYKPGTVVVKFASTDAVYAVSEGGVLHHYLTTSLIESDYGSNWASEDLEISSDVFFSNYTVGSDIDSTGDFDPDDAEDGVLDIDDNF